MLSRVGATSKNAVKSATKRTLFTSPAARSAVSLEEELPGVPTGTPGAIAQGTAGESQSSNGMKIITDDAPRSVATVSFVARAGSRYEDVNGTAHMLQAMAFRSTHNRSSLRLYQDFDKIGAEIASVSGRDYIVYCVSVTPDKVTEAVNLLGDAIVNARVVDYEVAEQRLPAEVEMETAYSTPSSLLSETIHAAGFRCCSPLGHGFFSKDYSLVTGDHVRELMERQVVASSSVLAGTGVDHALLKDLAESAFKNLRTGSARSPPLSKYRGGDARVGATGKATHVAVAFEAPGRNTSDAAAAYVLSALVSNASEKRQGFYAGYTDAGMVGASGAAPAESAGKLVSDIAAAVRGAGSASSEAIEAAKKKAALQLCMYLDRSRGATVSQAQQVLGGGNTNVFESVASVTAADVKRVAEAAASSAPSVAVVGNGRQVPYSDEI